MQFRFSQPLGFESLAASGDTRNIFFVNIDAASDRYDRRRGLRWSSYSGKNKYMCQNQLTVRNLWGEPLLPNTTYAVVLTNGIPEQRRLQRHGRHRLAMLIGDSRPDGAGGEAWDKYAALRAWLVDANVTARSLEAWYLQQSSPQEIRFLSLKSSPPRPARQRQLRASSPLRGRNYFPLR